MLASWGCVQSSPTYSAVSVWPRVPVPLSPTDLHFGSSLAIGFCRCASDRCWRISWSFDASSVLSAMSHICRAGLIHIGVENTEFGFHADSSRWPDVFEHDEICSCLADSGCDASVCASLLVNRASQVDERLYLPDMGSPPTVRWQLYSSLSARSSSCWSWALSLLMRSQGEWSCPASGCNCVTGAPGHQRGRGNLAVSKCPLYTVVPACCSGPHDPVNDNEEEERWKQAPLPNSSLHLETFRQLAGMGNSAVCPERCTGWGRLSSQGLNSVSVASSLSLYLHCRRPSHNLWSWCRGGSFTPVTVPQWCTGWRSGQHKIFSVGSLAAGLIAWGRQPSSSSPVEPC